MPDLLQDRALSRRPRAWMRRWYFDGETPHKERNAQGRIAWPTKFKFLPVTPHRVLSDDVPLYAGDDARDLAAP